MADGTRARGNSADRKDAGHYRFLKTEIVRATLEMKLIPNFAEAMETKKAKLLEYEAASVGQVNRWAVC
jgi:hypothetical protein